MSQTDAARLRSLMVTSTADLEEWLSRSRGEGSISEGEEGGDVAANLERLGLLDEFDA